MSYYELYSLQFDIVVSFTMHSDINGTLSGIEITLQNPFKSFTNNELQHSTNAKRPLLVAGESEAGDVTDKVGGDRLSHR